MDEVSIRSIQHFMYCPHRWGLMEVDCAWAENYYIVRGNIVHKRAHSAEDYSIRGKTVFTSVSVWNDEYGLYGITDCIEKEKGQYTIVEYKPTMPKDRDYREDDALQVFAQKLCVDNVFHCNCRAVLYYADQRRRVQLPFDEQHEMYLDKLKELINSIRYYKAEGKIPPIRKSQYCNGCSMIDICLPKIKKLCNGIKGAIIEFSKEEV